MTTAAADVSFRFLRDIASDLSSKEVSFPTFLDATLKIRRAVDDPSVDTETVARAVTAEPLVSAKIVQMANSAAVNPGGKPVSDVKSAIARVGFVSVRTVAVSVAVQQLRSSGDLAKFARRAELAWNHSVDVAAHAYFLAKKLTRINPDEALFAGLVHDIGYYYLLSKAGNYPELDADPAALDAVLAEWHAPIGQSVLHTFNLADPTLEAIAEHEVGHVRTPLRSLVDVVSLANLVCAATNPVRHSGGAGAPVLPKDAQIVATLAEAQADIQALAAILRQ
ncbi:MAG: HDOD domain-containing protein [Burkholderiales bacterium]